MVDNFRILHISDLHYSTDYFRQMSVYSSLMNQMDNPLEQLELILAKLNMDFNLVFLSGDICECGTVEEYDFVKNYLSKLFNCPVLVTAGNHDNIENLVKSFNLPMVDGELFNTYCFDGLKVICLNSGHKDYNDGFISEKSCDLLEEALKDNNENTIIMTHHHLIKDQFTLPAAQYPERLKEIIRSHDVLAVVTGHTHHGFAGTFEGKKYFTTGSLSFVVDRDETGELLFYEEPSALIYNLKNNEISCQKVTLSLKKNIGYLPFK